MGYLFSSFLWLYVLCLVPMGWIVDRFGALLATRVLMGAGEATTYPAAGRVVREWVPTHERALFTTIFNSGAYFGPAVGGLGLAALVGAAGWRSAFLACGAIGFLWLAAWLVWFRNPAEARWLGEEERSMLLRDRGATATASGPQHEIGITGLLRSPSMLGLMFTQGCGVYTQYLFLTWLPTYLQAERGLSIARSGWLTALPYFGAVILTILLGRLSDARLSPEAVQSGGRRRMVAAMMLVAAVILFVPFVTDVYMILFLIMVALSGVATTIGLNIALLSDLLRSTGDAGRATGLLILGGNIFGILAPIVTGYLVQATGHYDYAFVLAGALLLCGGLSALLLTRHPITG